MGTFLAAAPRIRGKLVLRRTAMQMGSMEQAGRNAAGEGIVLHRQEWQCAEYEEELALPETALHGLAVAVPLALAFWAIVGFLFWWLMR
jgi:hypothetical protein